MSSTLLLSGIVLPLLVFFVGTAAVLYYGDRIKTWAAQRSVEKMRDRISQLQSELDEAREAYESLSLILWRVVRVVYAVVVILPTILFNVLSLLLLVLIDLAIENFEDSSSTFTNPNFYLNPYFFGLFGILGSLYLIVSVFFTKPFRKLLKRLKNVAEYGSFKVEAEKAITHLEGRIKRLDK
jgi:F0F1-type ATP synthase membrane subunit b/b'